ncbi:unnamed protein product [Symbiodinium microadriaticum]|nr:unnamed protein product [Symbiodinium microadriaticum]
MLPGRTGKMRSAGSACRSQDLSFKGENRAVPIGQKLEVMVGGSCFLCEVAAYDEDQDYPYLLHFPAGDVKEKRCMIDVTSSRIIAPLWTREKSPFHFVDAEEEVSPLEMLTSHANGEPISPSQLVSLVRRARQQFQNEPALLRISVQGASTVSIFGDIHGNFAGSFVFLCRLQSLFCIMLAKNECRCVASIVLMIIIESSP